MFISFNPFLIINPARTQTCPSSSKAEAKEAKIYQHSLEQKANREETLQKKERKYTRSLKSEVSKFFKAFLPKETMPLDADSDLSENKLAKVRTQIQKGDFEIGKSASENEIQQKLDHLTQAFISKTSELKKNIQSQKKRAAELNEKSLQNLIRGLIDRNPELWKEAVKDSKARDAIQIAANLAYPTNRNLVQLDPVYQAELCRLARTALERTATIELPDQIDYSFLHCDFFEEALENARQSCTSLKEMRKAERNFRNELRGLAKKVKASQLDPSAKIRILDAINVLKEKSRNFTEALKNSNGIDELFLDYFKPYYGANPGIKEEFVSYGEAFASLNKLLEQNQLDKIDEENFVPRLAAAKKAQRELIESKKQADEFFITERSYFEALEFTKQFLDTFKNQLDKENDADLLEKMNKLSEGIETALQACKSVMKLQNGNPVQVIVQIFSNRDLLAQIFYGFAIAKIYLPRSLQLLKELTEDPRFAHAVNLLTMTTAKKIDDKFILPVQRGPRYDLFTEAIAKHTGFKGSEKVHATFEKINKKCKELGMIVNSTN